MAPPPGPRRGPSILVQDPRESRPQPRQRQTSQLITVDNVLQYASDVPSAQQRRPQRPRSSRTPSGRPADPRLTGRFAPKPHMPPRTTKTSEKLVLLPEAVEEEDDEKADFDAGPGQAPPKDGENMRKPGKDVSKSYAERLPKDRRTEKELPRVTAYCTAQSYKLQSTAKFLRQRHGARAKLYDDCLYCAYTLPLLPGHDGHRISSSPLLVSAKGANLLDEAIERSEQRDFRGDYYAEESEQHSVRGDNDESAVQDERRNSIDRRDSGHSNRSMSPSSAPNATDTRTYAEIFVLNYGVVVFWNFSERQEKDVLADLTFASIVDEKTNKVIELPLAINPLEEEDFETEEFHFEYNNEISRPRIYNDMITLRSGDHMIKLAISHAIAQSTKLSFFEESMAAQMDAAKDVPGRLAKTGELGLRREEVVKLLGGLFKSRVDVNLSSNVLDVPNLIWEDEPTLHPLYNAIREYLEIKPRIQVLNERCRVFLDLAEVLSDYISDNKMSRITWIVIILIGVSILVTCSEVFLRFGILSSRNSGPDAKAILGKTLSSPHGDLL